ncbi:MAG TPA: hypothetical protein VH089_18875 [Streptosporangiaceae bacterium]|nr:hypothetical protein [Streptosporangiaceae bacterium]
MRKLVLAVGGVLLITAGIVLAAVMAITPHGSPGVIGPAVVVDTAGSGTPGPTATPSTPAASPTSPSAGPTASPTGEGHVHSVSPSPAVQVTDDHGGGRRSGRHGD